MTKNINNGILIYKEISFRIMKQNNDKVCRYEVIKAFCMVLAAAYDVFIEALKSGVRCKYESTWEDI